MHKGAHLFDPLQMRAEGWKSNCRELYATIPNKRSSVLIGKSDLDQIMRGKLLTCQPTHIVYFKSIRMHTNNMNN